MNGGRGEEEIQEAFAEIDLNEVSDDPWDAIEDADTEEVPGLTADRNPSPP